MRTSGDVGNTAWVSAGLATWNDGGGAAEEDGTTKVAIAVVRGSRSSVILRHPIRAVFKRPVRTTSMSSGVLLDSRIIAKALIDRS